MSSTINRFFDDTIKYLVGKTQKLSIENKKIFCGLLIQCNTNIIKKDKRKQIYENWPAYESTDNRKTHILRYSQSVVQISNS